MTIMEAEKAIRYRSRFDNTGAFLDRGGRRMTSRLTGSTPRDCEGGPARSIVNKTIQGSQGGKMANRPSEC